MDLTITSESGVDDNRSWLGSAHAANAMDSITLVGALFTGTWTDGKVPSGVALGKVTASGSYGPYDDAASDGRQVMVGHLGTGQSVIGKDGATHNVGGALYWHGEVVEANLPASHGVDANGKADVGARIRYV